MKKAIELITQERTKQIEKHGYGIDHDQQHTHDYDDCDTLMSSPDSHSPLLKAAYSYLNIYGEVDANEIERNGDEFDAGNPNLPELFIPTLWPFDKEQWKGSYKNKIARLTIAAALIAAEIDRINNIK